MGLPLMQGPELVINGLHTAVGQTWVTLNDANQGFAAAGGEALEALSSDNTKDLAAGTGSRKYGLVYLDNSGNQQVATPWNTNGTTAAALSGVTNAWRINDFYQGDVGTDGFNTGDLTLRVGGAGATRAIIKANRKRAALGQFTVPLGYALLVKSATISRSANSGSVPLRLSCALEAEIDPATSNYVSGLWQTLGHGTAGLQQGFVDLVPFGAQFVIPALSTVRMRAQTESVSTCEVTGQIRGILVPA